MYYKHIQHVLQTYTACIKSTPNCSVPMCNLLRSIRRRTMNSLGGIYFQFTIRTRVMRAS